MTKKSKHKKHSCEKVKHLATKCGFIYLLVKNLILLEVFKLPPRIKFTPKMKVNYEHCKLIPLDSSIKYKC